MFGTYHINLDDESEIQEQLSAAIERSYGPEIKFDFNVYKRQNVLCHLDLKLTNLKV